MKNIILCATGCALLQSANSTYLNQDLFGGKTGGISGLVPKQGKIGLLNFGRPKKVANIPPATLLTEEGNYIKNGYFNYPQIPTDYEIIKSLPGWTLNEVERGIGRLYNPNWGNTVVVELDGNQNNVMKQSISLDPGHYILSFKWAGRTSYTSTSGMSVYWNNKKIFQVVAKDNYVHQQKIPIQVGQPGNFVLQFRGEGPSDSFGMTFTNLGLRRDSSKPKPLPLPPAGTLIEDGNFIKNGNFNFPGIPTEVQIVSNLPGWTSNEIERGIGSIYNSNWGNVVVAQLDGNQNNYIKQTISLDSGHYILSFKWAGRTSFISTSGMSVFWNNKKIFQVTANDSLVHEQTIPILITDDGNYELQFRGEGPSDTHGMTIVNLRLRRDLSKPKPLPLPPAGTLIEQGNFIKNGHFNFPRIPAEVQITSNLPGWTTNEIERGIGTIYNSNWGNVVVVQLDGNQNNYMKQSISLDSGYYFLSFKWAGRTSSISTSGMSVFWNKRKVFHVLANDNLVHQQVIPLMIRQPGVFELQFRGEGPSDTFGMTVTNLRLKLDQSRPKPLPLPPAGSLIEDGNYIKNGNFNYPQIQTEYEIINNLPEWSSNEVERGIGSIYNSNWGNIVVVQLDGNQNNFMKQIISLDSGYYLLRFKWAGRTSSITTSAMSVFWNNRKVFHVLANDNLVHQQVIPILVSEKGNYVLQFRAEGPSDSYGMTIAHLRLIKDLSQPKPQPLPIPVVIDSTEQVIIKPPNPNLKPDSETTVINYIQVDGSKFSRVVNINERLVEIKLWEINGFHIMAPNKFSSLLKQVPNVLVTSNTQSCVIRNKIRLTEGNYKFKFDHIAQKGNSNIQKLVVKLNDRIIGEAQPVGDELRAFAASFKVSKPGQFRFQIVAPKSGQAIGIVNPRLQIITDSTNNEDTLTTITTINKVTKPIVKKQTITTEKTTGGLIQNTNETDTQPEVTKIVRTVKTVQDTQESDQPQQTIDELLLPADNTNDNQPTDITEEPKLGSSFRY